MYSCRDAGMENDRGLSGVSSPPLLWSMASRLCSRRKHVPKSLTRKRLPVAKDDHTDAL